MNLTESSQSQLKKTILWAEEKKRLMEQNAMINQNLANQEENKQLRRMFSQRAIEFTMEASRFEVCALSLKGHVI